MSSGGCLTPVEIEVREVNSGFGPYFDPNLMSFSVVMSCRAQDSRALRVEMTDLSFIGPN